MQCVAHKSLVRSATHALIAIQRPIDLHRLQTTHCLWNRLFCRIKLCDSICEASAWWASGEINALSAYTALPEKHVPIYVISFWISCMFIFLSLTESNEESKKPLSNTKSSHLRKYLHWIEDINTHNTHTHMQHQHTWLCHAFDACFEFWKCIIIQEVNLFIGLCHWLIFSLKI